VKLIIKTQDNDGRLSLVREYLRTDWRIEVVDVADAGAFAHALSDADAMVSMTWRLSPPAPKLRLIQLPGAGVDEIDFAALPPIATLCNVFGHDIAIAEYVLAGMLEMSIGIGRMDRALRENNWRGSHLCGPRHHEIHGKTLGIVGYGRIGREVARRAAAFGMRIIACSRTAKPADEYVERVAGMDGLHPMLQESDFVLVACPLDQRTRGLINATAFAAMKPTAIIVNVARGPIIDEDALFQALRERKIGGAVIDVWYAYPAQGETYAKPARLPFHELDNIIMTPHASGWTENLTARRCAGIADNLNRLARGEPLVNVVRPAPLT
jgi:phosphoglycerate dehydrogenase-like enzyme